MDIKLLTRCRYCGIPAAQNKQGQWGKACIGCKGSLTRRLRSGNYGPTYAKETKERLKQMRYDNWKGKWVEGLDRHWYEYAWQSNERDEQGHPPLDEDYAIN